MRPWQALLIMVWMAGCAEPRPPAPPRATYDQDQTRQDIDRMIGEHGDPDGRLARLRDQLPSVPAPTHRPRQDVLLLKPGSGPRPVSPPVHAEQGVR